ncbi:TPA: transposase [bacterium]|nr:transposase [bacterium]
MINNKYLEQVKINAVKRYLNGEQKKKICEELGVAKSTMWGWICKYSSLIEKDWKIEDIKEANGEFIDITIPMKKANSSEKIIHLSNSTIRLFKNGYSILCDVSMLKEVIKAISND